MLKNYMSLYVSCKRTPYPVVAMYKHCGQLVPVSMYVLFQWCLLKNMSENLIVLVGKEPVVR